MQQGWTGRHSSTGRNSVVLPICTFIIKHHFYMGENKNLEEESAQDGCIQSPSLDSTPVTCLSHPLSALEFQLNSINVLRFSELLPSYRLRSQWFLLHKVVNDGSLPNSSWVLGQRKKMAIVTTSGIKKLGTSTRDGMDHMVVENSKFAHKSIFNPDSFLLKFCGWQNWYLLLVTRD